MTMDIAKEHVEYLASALETKAVTYHTAARDLGIHVSKSKTVLSSYYQANKSRVAASFIATGTHQGNLLVRVFESEAELTEKCGSVFDAVKTVHVYCLMSVTNSFTPAEIAMEERKHPTDLSKLTDYHALGLIKGPDLEKSQIRTSKLPSNAVQSTPLKPQTKPATSEPAKPEATSEKPKFVYQSRKQQPKTSMLSNYVSRKGEKKTDTTSSSGIGDKRPTSEKPSYEYKSRKVEKSQPKERVVVSTETHEDDLEEEAVERTTPPKSNVAESDLQNLFLDDFTDDEKESGKQDVEVEQPIVVEHSEPLEEGNNEETPTETIQTNVIPKDDIWKTMTSNSPAPDIVAEKDTTPAPETTVDEDGYFTSYKKSEPKPEPVKRPAREQPKPAKAAKKGDGKKKQASVMSFFQKR